ncbi:transporter substrate-binding protein [Peribacillus huizhouensis]|uniref:Transcriptional regulator with PAS, ATPase and Fis domain/ABC-type branched-subunit amino acid transport system substrate-binding protein n=1 Tax=Peribacillus huizhouensis TaxID=1501239 RepID=A0ABR6CLY1_9BACI|nr:transporter substrate-binding protein [Peribacillus huizhouensis]MBA9025560.1 transcriptional regulator with PAS, ATPase and Fis domain/ABC-type branched-subunit amino acid transport system substrate-binding protein [Peribacillus huizhouensis]
MDNLELKVGILFSLTGTTSITEQGLHQASLLAIRHINESGGINGKKLVPIVEDVASDPYLAARKAEKLITSDKVAAIVGLYTSGCRKIVIPVLEKHNALLFYPTFYEGSEQHPNVIYCGSLPNQQLLDFIPWLIQNVGKSFYLLGSDYIYPLETNRHIRQLIQTNGGTIYGAKYVALGHQNFAKTINEIRGMNPDIIFSTLVGDSALSFYQQHEQHGLHQPIASTVSAETEIAALHPYKAIGHYSCFPYFSSIDSDSNNKFITEYRRTYGTDVISSMIESAYNSVLLLAEALKRTDTISTDSIRGALSGLSLETPQGKVMYDVATQHFWLNSRIGKVNETGQFTIVWESGKPIEPIPFLEHNLSDSTLDFNPIDDTFHLKSKIMQHDSLLTMLKKSLSALPVPFGYFDEDGVMLEIFNSSLIHTQLHELKPGANGYRGSLGKSGIGLALRKYSTSYEETRELRTGDTQYGTTTVGFPIIGNSGVRKGVLAVWITDTGPESTELLLKSIASIVHVCANMADIEEEQRTISDVLHGVSAQLTKSLFVIKEGRVLFQNQTADTLFKRKRDLVNSVLLEISSEQEESIENFVRTLRREDSDESYEVKVIYKNSMHFIYFKLLPRQMHRFSLKERRNLTTNDLIGSNELFLQTIGYARSAAKTKANVLLLGESGTGKEMFARAIHNESKRKEKPFIAINCASISKELINSELFGYEDGAFTGAKKGGNAGKFEIANGGTLFLDEIGDMPIDLQSTLLRVLQEKEVVRVGGYKPIPVDVRIIAATNKNLFQEIAYNGSFRSDLYYRLNVFTIELIPLRKRTEDIIKLSSYYLEELSADLGQPRKELSTEAAELIRKYNWPGNIRELNNVIERAFYLAEDSPFIMVDHLPQFIIHNSNALGVNTRDLLIESLPDGANIEAFKQKSDEHERQVYIQTLMNHKWNISKTAKQLGISRTTLYRKLKEHNIQARKVKL